jgi:hypothetical protein
VVVAASLRCAKEWLWISRPHNTRRQTRAAILGVVQYRRYSPLLDTKNRHRKRSSTSQRWVEERI